MVRPAGAGLWFPGTEARDPTAFRESRVGSSRTQQEVRTLMTVTVTGAARVQEFVFVSAPVVSG
ncbi:hypothetical protein GCM10010302_59740 [Streptomyces polychromogenes]|uniref:Uncharacterized protein n=1 Tax=Streptomyces polychromogenes TaxID=67342 RepID=A0ABN0VND4_9ACTN